MLVSAVTATGAGVVSDYYLSWHLLLRGVQLGQIRADPRPARGAGRSGRPAAPDGGVHLSTATVIAYADIARSLLQWPVEAPPIDQ